VKKTIGDVLKLFKKSFCLNGDSRPNLRAEWDRFREVFTFSVGTSGTRLADVLRYYHRDILIKDEGRAFHAS